jgi:integrase
VCAGSTLAEPFGKLAFVCVCFGLRISECLALQWQDVGWLNSTLRVERGIVAQTIDSPKTEESRKSLPIASDFLRISNFVSRRQEWHGM